jgi:hypothetical protein
MRLASDMPAQKTCVLGLGYSQAQLADRLLAFATYPKMQQRLCI